MSAELGFQSVDIDCSAIHDRPSFHAVFKEKMGFPEFYGANMDAWIDSMTRVDEPADNMSKIHAPSGGVLVIQLGKVKDFRRSCPEIFEDLISCAAFVNFRRMERGNSPVLSLSFKE